MTPWFTSSPHKSTGTASASGRTASDADKQTQLLTVANAVKYMVPPQSTTNVRFSLLLLEFGETLLQDWAVVVATHQVVADPKGTRARSTGTANTHSTSTITRTTTAHAKGSKTPWDKSSQGRNNSRRVAPQSTTPTASLSLQGRLHLCTKSLVFEPDEPLRPIWRFPFSKMEAPPSEIGDTLIGKSSLGDSYEIPLSIQFTAMKYWAMKEMLPSVPMKCDTPHMCKLPSYIRRHQLW
jgi:hypothetical protein